VPANKRVPMAIDDISRKLCEIYNLTAQEFKIIHFMIENMASNREIAAHFGIAQETVKRHLSNIFDKMGASTRLELVLMFLNRRHELVVGDMEKLPMVIALRAQVSELDKKLLYTEAENRRLIARVTFAENCVDIINKREATA
jgi:DNA-binding CsgD family transcriptional regulator